MPRQPNPTTSRRGRGILGLGIRAWIGVAIAFIAGVALFATIWTKQRSQNDFFRADDTPRNTSGQQLDPLPGPDTGRIATDSVPTRPAATPSAESETPEPAHAQPLSMDAPPLSANDPADAGKDAEPVAIDSPPPRYPPASLRRGETGEVLLRIHVDREGRPGEIDLVRGSGSSRLDRAATEAVRRWRFRPAVRAGQPIEGVKMQQVAFTLPR